MTIPILYRKLTGGGCVFYRKQIGCAIPIFDRSKSHACCKAKDFQWKANSLLGWCFFFWRGGAGKTKHIPQVSCEVSMVRKSQSERHYILCELTTPSSWNVLPPFALTSHWPTTFGKPASGNKKTSAKWFKVTFLGWLSDLFKGYVASN